MRLTLRHIVRWLAWHLGELDRPLDEPPAHITVFSGADTAVESERTA